MAIECEAIRFVNGMKWFEQTYSSKKNCVKLTIGWLMIYVSVLVSLLCDSVCYKIGLKWFIFLKQGILRRKKNKIVLLIIFFN
mgnify:CR=1 FL=1